MSELTQSIFIICATAVSIKYMEYYFNAKRDIAILGTVDKSINSICKIQNDYYKSMNERPINEQKLINELPMNEQPIENENLYKIFLEILLNSGFTEAISKKIIIAWINRGYISPESNERIKELTDFMGSRLIKELKIKLESEGGYNTDDSE